MAILGERLEKPESGWKRIDINEFMETIDDDIKNITGYNQDEFSFKTHSYIYKFTGTKIRLVSTLYTIKPLIYADMPAYKIDENNNKTDTAISVKGDWVGSVFIDCEFAGRIYSDFENEDKDGQTLTLMFEKTDIPDGEHLLNVSIYSPFINDRRNNKVFDLEFIDIDKDAEFDCFTYNEDYTLDQLVKFINLNYNELVNDFPNKIISCNFFFEGIYMNKVTNGSAKIKSFPYYLNNFELIDIKDIPKSHPARINTYGTIYDLDDILEICEDLSSPFVNKLCKFSFDSIMITRRLQYSISDNVDLEKDFYLYQEKIENEELGKVEVNVVPNSIVIKTKKLVELKNEGYFSGITYFRGNSADSDSIFIERVLYSKDNINWYTYNIDTNEWELVGLDQINTKGIVIYSDSYNKLAINNPSSSEYKKFFNNTTEIGVAIGFSPNPKISNISTYYANINYCFLSFNQNMSDEEIYKGFYYLSYPMTTITDKLYFIPIPSKNSEFGEFSFLSSYYLTYQKNANFDNMFSYSSGYVNKLKKILWRYNYFSEYSSTNLCHFLLSQPYHQNQYKISDLEYSEYLKFLNSDPNFKESFLFYEGIYNRSTNSTGSSTESFKYVSSPKHFDDWVESYEKAGAKYYSNYIYNYMPRFRLTFKPILNKNNLIKNNWRCITYGNSI